MPLPATITEEQEKIALLAMQMDKDSLPILVLNVAGENIFI